MTKTQLPRHPPPIAITRRSPSTVHYAQPGYVDIHIRAPQTASSVTPPPKCRTQLSRGLPGHQLAACLLGRGQAVGLAVGWPWGEGTERLISLCVTTHHHPTNLPARVLCLARATRSGRQFAARPAIQRTRYTTWPRR